MNVFLGRVPRSLLLVATLGCRPGLNYPSPSEPRHAGVATAVMASRGDTLRVVSFNIEFAQEMRRAIHVLRTHPALRDADVVLLQEMDAPGARLAAGALRMHHVYYPAIYNRLARRDVGNAVLSRWPIVDDAKLILPSRSRYAKTQRIATAATIRVSPGGAGGSRDVRVYSTHLGTPADLGWEGRVAQITHILRDAERFPRVILGGDMNSREVGRVVRDAGYAWPTDTIPPSNMFGRLDHLFTRGVAIPDSAGAGTVPIPPGVSDHRPVWIRVVLPRE